ncbi:MAG: thermonuclease family protein [Pseudomonadota bacterium]
MLKREARRPPSGSAPLLALLLILTLAWPALAASAAPAGEWAAVLFVNDGDTISVRLAGRKELVRLLGVDAPETGHSLKLGRVAAQAGRTTQEEARLGRMARDFVLGLLPRPSRVRLAGDPRAGERDKYGRLLAYVYLEDGRMLNELLLDAGQARVYRHCRCAGLGRFQALEAQARRERRGLWALGGP